ncbi:succinate dehydrogenase assembly factor 4 mitochondrial [Tripterygium wilfordii]|uniref:Succinate dehydrogenase assembly factor 4, mitochondrial n=1 Tax=Tripterygium wilfordii TaxID=458696 RepID=A0A7J7DAS5_TRIWF|nr:succinate dehydrogenase assembly factor 4, mitochondrial [Tripterygium wilfordii]KAF5743462.1 succinate dehydrogenase assembly factor 4 mitochondrial [Tripterygium wilfordii]
MGGRDLGRLFSSIAALSAPKLAIPYTRSDSVTLSVTKSAIRFISSSTQQQEHREKPSQEETETVKENLGREKEEEEEDDEEEDEGLVNKDTGEIGGPRGPEPTRYGDWERNGRCSDF